VREKDKKSPTGRFGVDHYDAILPAKKKERQERAITRKQGIESEMAAKGC